MTPPRITSLLVAGALAVVLIAGSAPHIIGDGVEYVAQALNFATLHAPPINGIRAAAIESRIAAFDPRFAEWRVTDVAIRGADGHSEFPHFWFYALLATPGVWVTEGLGIAPTYAFAALNLILLGVALWVALPRIGAAASILIFASPIVWWIDKAHTEAFTFALLIVTFALIDDQPWWSMVAAAAASTQNPPIAIVPCVVFLVTILRRPSLRTDRRFLMGTLAALFLVLSAPAYTYARYGTASLLFQTTRSGIPPFAEISAVVFDPTIGLLGNFPAWLLVGAVALVLVIKDDARQLLSASMTVMWIAAATFLFAFARTANFHHGGTPSLSRYALWLIPLAVPMLMLARARQRRGRAWQVFLTTTATASALVSMFAFHPSVPEHAHDPTWLAEWLWTREPAWNNPLPEVFIETLLHSEEMRAPVTAGKCAKILIAGQGMDDGLWPAPCDPAPIPANCRRRGAKCYANLGADHTYTFVTAPGRWTGDVPLQREWTWPAAAEPHVRELYDKWDWWNLPSRPEGLDALRDAHDVRASAFGGAERFILVLSDFGAEPSLRFRLPGPMTGTIVDPATGQVVAEPRFDGPAGEPWILPLPNGFNWLLLRMTSPSKPPQ